MGRLRSTEHSYQGQPFKSKPAELKGIKKTASSASALLAVFRVENLSRVACACVPPGLL
jgi:hypothetical protein